MGSEGLRDADEDELQVCGPPAKLGTIILPGGQTQTTPKKKTTKQNLPIPGQSLHSLGKENVQKVANIWN